MECILVFKGKHSSAVELISEKITLIREVEEQCPKFFFNVTLANNTKPLFSATCGGYIIPINRTFDQFKSAHIFYDNEGLSDNISNINITFELVEKKGNICFKQDRKFSLEHWKNILIAVLSLMFLIILIVILIIICKKCKKKVSKEVTVEGGMELNGVGNHNDRPDTNNENLELRNSLELNSFSSELKDEFNSRANTLLETFNIS